MHSKCDNIPAGAASKPGQLVAAAGGTPLQNSPTNVLHDLKILYHLSGKMPTVGSVGWSIPKQTNASFFNLFSNLSHMQEPRLEFPLRYTTSITVGPCYKAASAQTTKSSDYCTSRSELIHFQFRITHSWGVLTACGLET
jgi:hypothetical protein